jgi:hypothetical protein
MTSYSKERTYKSAEKNPKAVATQHNLHQVKHDISIFPTYKNKETAREFNG